MANPILVCGLGQVGFRVCSLLLDIGEKVVAVTDVVRPEWARILEERGVTIVRGDARDEAVLLSAGLREAKALIAATSSDLTNIEIALDAKRHRSDLPIVTRMFDSSLARQLEQNLDVRRAMAMSQVAAPAFAAATLGDQVVAEFEQLGLRLVVFRLDVTPAELGAAQNVGEFEASHGVEVLTRSAGSTTVNPGAGEPLRAGDVVFVLGSAQTLRTLRPELRPAPLPTRRRRTSIAQLWKQTTRELRFAFVGLVVLTLVSVAVFQVGMGLRLEDALYFVITTVTTTGYGDITPKDSSLWVKLYTCFMMAIGSATVAVLYSIVTDFIVTRRLQQLVGGQDVPDSGHVIVAGIGDVGFRIVEELERIGASVVAIDKDANAPHIATIRARIPVVFGDARDLDTLLRAGMDRAISLVAASGDDALNLSIGLAAEAINPGARSVLRLFDASFATKVQTSLNIDAAMSASRIAAPSFVSAALHDDMHASFVLEGRLFSVLGGEGAWAVRCDPDGRVGEAETGSALHIEVRVLKSPRGFG